MLRYYLLRNSALSTSRCQAPFWVLGSLGGKPDNDPLSWQDVVFYWGKGRAGGQAEIRPQRKGVNCRIWEKGQRKAEQGRGVTLGMRCSEQPPLQTGGSELVRGSCRHTCTWWAPGAERVRGAVVMEVRGVKRGPESCCHGSCHRGRDLALKLKGEPGGAEQRGDLLWFSFWKIHSDCRGWGLGVDCRSLEATQEAVAVSPAGEDGGQEVTRSWMRNSLGRRAPGCP